MPRLIWVFAGRTFTLLVLSCRGSYGLMRKVTFHFRTPFAYAKNTYEPRHDKTNKMSVRPAQSDSSLRCPHEERFGH